MNPFAFRTRIESHPEELLALAKIWAVSTGRLDAIKALDSLPSHPSRAEVDPFAPYVSNWLADETAPKNVNLFPPVIKQIYEMPNPVKLLSEIRMDAVKLSDSDLSVTLSHAGKTADFHFDSIDSNLTKGGLITLLAEMHNDAHNPINFDGTMKSIPPLTPEYLSTIDQWFGSIQNLIGPAGINSITDFVHGIRDGIYFEGVSEPDIMANQKMYDIFKSTGMLDRPIKEAIRNYSKAQPMRRPPQKSLHGKFATLKDAAKALNASFSKSNDKAVTNDVR